MLMLGISSLRPPPAGHHGLRPRRGLHALCAASHSGWSAPIAQARNACLGAVWGTSGPEAPLLHKRSRPNQNTASTPASSGPRGQTRAFAASAADAEADALSPILLTGEEQAFPATAVCVTGCTGYVAGVVVARLLAAGHTVHGTCRSPSSTSAAMLLALPGAGERLKLFKADLLDEGAFDEAMKGCTHVMHCASPFVNGVTEKNAEEVLLKPALKGTENVLGSVDRTPSVGRVVLTSSVVATYHDADDKGPGGVFTEEDWNEKSTPGDQPYPLSKTLAERRAWEMQRAQSRWSMATINPGFVLGPGVGAHPTSESYSFMKGVMAGALAPYFDLGFGVVDVRDVAKAHCLCMVKDGAEGRPAVEGRFITTSASPVSLPDMRDALADTFPERKVASFKLPGFLVWLLQLFGVISKEMYRHMYKKPITFSNARIKRELGMEFIPYQRTLVDFGRHLLQEGIVEPLPSDKV